jgi:hypothetical protein
MVAYPCGKYLKSEIAFSVSVKYPQLTVIPWTGRVHLSAKDVQIFIAVHIRQVQAVTVIYIPIQQFVTDP